MTATTVPINGIDLHVERRGSGRPLLFINGSGATLATSELLLAPFADRFDVACHDQRALGGTTVPAQQPTMADYAADALALLDHLGWERPAVAGISFGGMVAQELAVTAPDRIGRLALLCTSPGGAGGSSYPLHELAALDPAARAAIATQVLDTRFTPEWLADPAHWLDAGLAKVMASRTDGDKTHEQQRGEAMQLEARRHHDVWDRLPRITCPVLAAAGRFDGIAALANSEAIASQVAGAELRVYEGGHAFFVQDPRAIPETLDWLDAS